jgi:hypothetical protein
METNKFKLVKEIRLGWEFREEIEKCDEKPERGACRRRCVEWQRSLRRAIFLGPQIRPILSFFFVLSKLGWIGQYVERQ